MKADALFNALCNTLADLKTEPVRESLAGVEEKIGLIVDALGESVAEPLAETLSETVKAEGLLDAVTDTLAEVEA